jgi:cell division protein YceG involved in septum cleavage
MNSHNTVSPQTLYRKRSIQKQKRREAQLRGRLFLIALIITILFVLSGIFGTYFAKAQSTEELTNYKYYTQITISYGENLSSIAEEYMGNEYSSIQSYIDEVSSINNIDNPNSILEGQTIIVPYYSTELK